MTNDAMQPQATAAVSHGQAETLEAIYRAHVGGLRGRLVAQTRDPALADDLVSEAFLRSRSRSVPDASRGSRRPGSIGSAPTSW